MVYRHTILTVQLRASLVFKQTTDFTELAAQGVQLQVISAPSF